MSDYDTKIIPILDDIIEIEATENVITLDDSPVGPDDLSHPTKNNLDLFSEEAGDIVNEHIGPQVGIIDDIIDDQDDEAEHIDFESAEFSVLDTVVSYETEIQIDASEDDSAIMESALIDFNDSIADDYAHFSIGRYPAADQAIEADPGAQTIGSEKLTDHRQSADEVSIRSVEALIEASSKTSAEISTLESIVNDIVKQLIPNMEQQIRILVQQALKDRLSAEVLDQLIAKDNKS
jgi:hypothetical protein